MRLLRFRAHAALSSARGADGIDDEIRVASSAAGVPQGGGGAETGGGGAETGGGGAGSGGAPIGGGPEGGGVQCEADPPGTEANATEPGFSETPACDPIGSWAISFDAPLETSLSPSEVAIVRDGQDRLVVEGAGIKTATVQPDGCMIEIRWFNHDAELIDDQCFECFSELDVLLLLTAESDIAAGTYQYEEAGECSSLQTTGTVTLTRSSP